MFELEGGEMGSDHLVTHRSVCASGHPQRLSPVVCDHSVGDPRVGRAAAAVGEARLLQPVQKPGNAGRGEAEAVSEIDPPHDAMLGAGEVEQRLEVIRTEAILGEEARLDLAHQRAVSMQKPSEHGLR